MDTDNFFFILELPFSPVPDTATVEEAIAKKQSEWSRQLNNPRRKDNAKKWLANIGLMHLMLADPDARNTLAKQAENIQQEKLSELEKLLELNYVEEKLSKKDIGYLLNRYGFYQITGQHIQDLYKKVQQSRQAGQDTRNPLEEEWDSIELPDRFQMDNIENLLKIIGKNSLYQFLEQSEHTTSWQLLGALDNLEKTLRESTTNDQNEASKKLCGFARDIFSSETERQKYDCYLDIKAWQHLYQWIDINADTNDKNVVQTDFLSRLFQQLPAGTDYEKVAKAISLYCRFRKYQIADTEIHCPQCSTGNKQAFFCSRCHAPLFFIPGNQHKKQQDPAADAYETDDGFDTIYGNDSLDPSAAKTDSWQRPRNPAPQPTPARPPAPQRENPVPQPAPVSPPAQQQEKNDSISQKGCLIFALIFMAVVLVIFLVIAISSRNSSRYISRSEFENFSKSAIEASMDATYGKPDSTGCRNLPHSDGSRYCMKVDAVEYMDAPSGNGAVKRAYVTVRGTSDSYSSKTDLLGLMVFEWNPSEKRVQMVSGVKDLVIGHDSQFEKTSLQESFNRLSESSRLIRFGKDLYGWVLHDVPGKDAWGALKVYSPLHGSTIKEVLNIREGSVPPAPAMGENGSTGTTACTSAPCYPAPQITGLKAEIRTIESPKEDFYPIELTYTIQSSGGPPPAPPATKKTVMLSFDKSLGSYAVPEEIKSIGNRSAYDGEDAPAASAPAASSPDPSASAAPAAYYNYGSEFEGEYHTSRHSIRITKRNGRYLYQAWKQPKTMDEGPPDLMLTNGEDSTDGITFKKGNLVIDINRSSTADKELYIFINNVYRDHYYMYRN